MAQNIDPVNGSNNSTGTKDGDGPASATKHQSTSKRWEKVVEKHY